MVVSGVASPAITLKRLDLPWPLSPSTPTFSPRFKVKVTPLKMTLWGYERLRFWRVRRGVVIARFYLNKQGQFK
jgi:hypothetical protein